MKLDYEMGEQEPWWVTVIAVILFFLIWGIFVLPRELEKKRKEEKRRKISEPTRPY